MEQDRWQQHGGEEALGPYDVIEPHPRLPFPMVGARALPRPRSHPQWHGQTLVPPSIPLQERNNYGDQLVANCGEVAVLYSRRFVHIQATTRSTLRRVPRTVPCCTAAEGASLSCERRWSAGALLPARDVLAHPLHPRGNFRRSHQAHGAPDRSQITSSHDVRLPLNAPPDTMVSGEPGQMTQRTHPLPVSLASVSRRSQVGQS